MKTILSILTLLLLTFATCRADVIEISSAAQLQSALSTTPPEGTEFRLINDIAPNMEIKIKSNNYSLNLNNHIITCPINTTALRIYGTFNIYGPGKIIRTKSEDIKFTIVLNSENSQSAILNIYGGDICYTSQDGVTSNTISVPENNILNIYGGTISSAMAQNGTINNEGTVNIYGGTIKNTSNSTSATACRAIYTSSKGTINIYGGEISSSNGYAIFNNKGQLNISNAAKITGDINKYNTYLLSDDAPLEIKSGFDVDRIEYNRGASNTFGTVCLPFAPTGPEGITYYTLKDIDTQNGLMTFTEVLNPQANTPYIYCTSTGTYSAQADNIALQPTSPSDMPQTASGNWMLKGVYQRTSVFDSESDPDYATTSSAKTVEPNAYYIKNNAFSHVNGYFTTKPFRAFITASGIQSPNFGIALSDLTDAQSAAAEDAQPVAIYDTNGRSRTSLAKGLNIVRLSNGKSQTILVE